LVHRAFHPTAIGERDDSRTPNSVNPGTVAAPIVRVRPHLDAIAVGSHLGCTRSAAIVGARPPRCAGAPKRCGL